MASKYLQKYPVPAGFPDILHDFAREVLRDQPDNIKEYGWQYFKALEEGVPFDYKKKGKAIPPPKDRKPNHNNYYQVDPSPNAHIHGAQDRPTQQRQPVHQQQQQRRGLDENQLRQHDKQNAAPGLHHNREHSVGQKSQEEIDANNYVNNLMERVSVRSNVE
ncbi:UNKNOWN [Stylonychia lemnae]|uniref:RIIa domain-containing protein n=1 Tax=Stylonychia lemnae TaxID=5949 RepID=A0A078ALD1_STYLE|nr:UNKNOWN [Stylonychia lemnae]|eukprot:CDW81668.1 UNKNOWN [Stylonychia lemnae]